MNFATKRPIKKTVVCIISLLGISGFTAHNANARGEASLKESPGSVSIVTADILTDKWSMPRDISDISRLTPNVSLTNTSSGTANVTLRGLSNLNSQPSSTLMLVNGQRVLSSFPDIDPNDIARVDVIRGASATAIYGSDAVAGVVNIITKNPREESSGSFVNPDSSPYRDNPFQSGYRAMAAAETDPIGQGLSAFYDAGGGSGKAAGDMFASAAKIRYSLGGPLCDLGTTSSQDLRWLSDEAARCLTSEMLGYQTNFDNSRGTVISDQLGGEYITSGLKGLGFDPQMASNLATSRFPGFIPSTSGVFDRYPWNGLNYGREGIVDSLDVGLDWNRLTDFRTSPALLDHFLNYSSSGKYVLPARDNNQWSLDLSFGEQNFGRDPQETFKPNDPLYKKPDTTGRKVSGVLKKGFGALLGASGLGVGLNETDSKSDDQWSLHAVGYSPMGEGTSAWDVVDGREKNVVVAVIDSGLDLNHPDRPAHIWRNPGEIPDNNIDDDTNGYVDDINGWNFVAESNDIDDDYGHGTFVAGIIAANTDNGIGIAGINPGAQLMTLKVSDRNGLSRSLAIYRALRYAVDNGARIINISLGRKGLSRLEQIGINYAYAMGCVVVVAAGNQGGDIAQYGPPGARRVFSVSSLNIDESSRSQSNKGLGVAVAAPGESIYSLTAKNGKRDGRIIPMMAGEYHRLNGTSFAAPIVAGTASLILANNPYLSNREVEDMILASAVDTEEPGWDKKTGMGKLNARYALTIQPEAAFSPRITDWIINEDKSGKISSVDVYGVIRGPLASYAIAVGQGNSPSNWTPVFGPANRLVQHGHITRIPGSYFKKGSSWSVQLSATAVDGQSRVQEVLVRKTR